MAAAKSCANCGAWSKEGERPVGAGVGGAVFGADPARPRECRARSPLAEIVMVPIPRSALAPGNGPGGVQPSVMSFHPLTTGDHWCAAWRAAHGLAPVKLDPSRMGGLTRAPTVDEFLQWMQSVESSGVPTVPLDGE